MSLCFLKLDYAFGCAFKWLLFPKYTSQKCKWRSHYNLTISSMAIVANHSISTGSRNIQRENPHSGRRTRLRLRQTHWAVAWFSRPIGSSWGPLRDGRSSDTELCASLRTTPVEVQKLEQVCIFLQNTLSFQIHHTPIDNSTINS